MDTMRLWSFWRKKERKAKNDTIHRPYRLAHKRHSKMPRVLWRDSRVRNQREKWTLCNLLWQSENQYPPTLWRVSTSGEQGLRWGFGLLPTRKGRHRRNQKKTRIKGGEMGIVERNGATAKLDSIYLKDPDGNLVEIAVAKNNLK